MNGVSSFVSITFIFTSIAILINFARILLSASNSIELQTKYGPLIDGLNLVGFLGTFWNLIVLIRWGLTAVVLVFLKDNAGL